MKWSFILCLLAVYSVQALPNLDKEVDINEEENVAESNKKFEKTVEVNSRDKREVGDDPMPEDRVKRESGPEPPSDLNVDVDVNINVPGDNVPVIDVDVAVNINADETEEPVIVLSGSYIPWNNGFKEFEASIALKKGFTLVESDPLSAFLNLVTKFLQEKIRSANLDPLTIGGLGFNVVLIQVKIEPGKLTGLSGVVLDGHLVENADGAVEGVRLSGELGELVGSSEGFARIAFFKHEFEVKATIGSTKILMDVKVDKVACKLTVEKILIELGEIKVEVKGVPSIIGKIIEFVVNKFGFLLEKLLNLQTTILKSLINTALSAITIPPALRIILGCTPL